MYIKRLAEDILKKQLSSKKVSIIIGARQVGKTTLVQHLLKGKKCLFLNMDIDVDKLRLKDISALPPADALIRLGSPDYIVIDEAQQVPETGKIVKAWYDSKLPVKTVLLGSSSLNLLNQTAESLTGRNEKIYLTPLTFAETLCKESWFTPGNEGSYQTFSTQIQDACFSTMIYGQYPESITTRKKEEFLFEIVSDYLLKDVLQLGLIKTPNLIKKLLMLLASQIGSLVSVNELSNTLGMSRITVDHYLDLLEQTFVIFRLPAFGTNSRKEIAKSQKIFFWDTGIRNALLKEFSNNKMRADIGQLFENWVIAEYAKLNLITGNLKNLYFWRSKTGSEIDLVIKENEKLTAYEIKWNKNKTIQTAFTLKYGIPATVLNFYNFYTQLLLIQRNTH